MVLCDFGDFYCSSIGSYLFWVGGGGWNLFDKVYRFSVLLKVFIDQEWFVEVELFNVRFIDMN